MPPLLPSTCKAEAVVTPVSVAKELEARKNGGVDCLTRRQNQRSEPPDMDLRPAAVKKEPPFGAPNAGTGIGTGVGQPREEGGRHMGSDGGAATEERSQPARSQRSKLESEFKQTKTLARTGHQLRSGKNPW